MRRESTKPIKIGNLQIGGSNHIVIQSMTTSKTKNVKETLKQIYNLVKHGCELVRVSIVDDDDIIGLKKIVKKSPVPIVADIHFNHTLAIKAIEAGAAKIRLNPGNINKEHLEKIVILANKYNVAIRVGVNSGSLPIDIEKKYGISAKAMVETAKSYVKKLEDLKFNNIIISLKCSIPMLALESYKLASKIFKYPLHLGITEAGSILSGAIKSAVGLTPLLLEGIGDTIRISLSGDPVEEIKVAKKMLFALGLYKNMVDVISCPTCGRLNFNIKPVLAEIEEFVKDMNFPLSIAILGCAVNGPGESRHADIGIAGGNGQGIIYFKGKIFKTCNEKNLVGELKKLILIKKREYFSKNH